MSKKKVIITSVSCLAAAALLVGGVFGISTVRESKKSVDVYSVALLNAGYYSSENNLQSEGTVTSDSAQSVYLGTSQQIEEVCVQEGDTVSIGDKLMTLDLTSLTLSIKVKELTIQSEQYELEGLQKEYAALQKKNVGDPVDDSYADYSGGDYSAEAAATNVEALAVQSLDDDGDYGDYVPAEPDFTSTEDAASGSGSQDDPYVFLCESTTTVSGALLNELKDGGLYARFDVYDDGTVDGNLEQSLFVNGASLSKYDEDAVVALFLSGSGDEDDDDDDDDNGDDNGDDDNGGEYDDYERYTAETLAKALRDKKQEVADADLTLRKDQLELEQMQEEAEDGVVYAKINGTVKTCHTMDDIPTDGSAFMTILGSDGMYIRGGIDELHLDQLEVGSIVNAYDYESGNYMEGYIAAIDDYPSTDVYSYGSENPNTSTYAYTAYFEDVEELSVGQWVELTIAQSDSEDESAIYLDKAYIRKDDSGKSYVYKEDGGKLVKQEVSTGQYLWGEYIEIKSGITQDDYIAFPYGDAAEGIRCQESEDIDYGDSLG